MSKITPITPNQNCIRGTIKLHPKLTRLPFDLMGPIVKGKGSTLLSVDLTTSLISRDAGKTWGARPLYDYKPTENEYKISRERVLLRTKEGSLILSFMNYNERRWLWDDKLGALPGTRVPQYVMRSTDDGKTWEPATLLHEDWTGDIRNIIQLKSGRLVLSSMRMFLNPTRHTVLTYISDDDGVTWKPSNIIDLGGCGHHDGATEASVIELNDGRLWFLIRTNLDYFWQAYSHDAGETWTELGPTQIDTSSSPGLLTRLQSGRIMLVWNRLKKQKGGKVKHRGGDNIWSTRKASWQREEISVAFSEDDGKTWSDSVVIATNKDSQVCYPRALEYKPGEIWLTTMFGNLRAKFFEKDFI